MSATPITLPAVFTPNDDAEPGSGLGALSAWCGHCERLHHHGAAGRGGAPRNEQRGSHCDPGSPLAGRSYELAVAGSSARTNDTMPAAPMVEHALRLQDALREGENDLRRSLFLASVGPGATAIHHPPGDTLSASLGKVELMVTGWGRCWQIRERRKRVDGRGLLGLLSRLFAVSPGIAGRRVLETVTATRFPPDGALEIEASIDRWADQAEAQQ